MPIPIVSFRWYGSNTSVKPFFFEDKEDKKKSPPTVFSPEKQPGTLRCWKAVFLEPDWKNSGIYVLKIISIGSTVYVI